MKIKQSILTLSTTALFAAAMSATAWADLSTLATMDDLVSAGTLTGGVDSTNYEGGTVYSFDGTGAILNITNSDITSYVNGGSGYLIVAGWVNADTVSGDGTFFSAGGQYDGFKYGVNEGTLRVTTKARRDYTSDFSLTAGEWTFVALAFALDGTSSSRIYSGTSDGNYCTRWFSSWNESSTDAFAIGSGCSDDVWCAYTGQIANLTILSSDTLVNNSAIAEIVGTVPDTTKIKGLVEVELAEGYWTWKKDAFVGEAWSEEDDDWISIQRDWTNNGFLSLSMSESEGAAYIKIGESGVATSGIVFSGSGNVQITDGELTILEGGRITANDDANLTINSNITFVNGGRIEGNVETSDTATMRVLAGTLSIADISSGTLEISEGATVKKTKTINDTYTLAAKLSGSGTLVVSAKAAALSFSGTEDEGFSGVLKVTSSGTSSLNLTNFSGSLEYSGGLNLEDSDLSDISKLHFFASGSIYSKGVGLALDTEIEDGYTLSICNGSYWGGANMLVSGNVEGKKGNLFLQYENSMLTFSGEIDASKVSVGSWSGSVTFSNNVNVGTFESYNSAAVTFEKGVSQIGVFRGGMYRSGILNIESDAVMTITGEGGSDPSEGAFVVSKSGGQTVNVRGVLNLQNDSLSNVNSTGTINVYGEMNFNKGVFLNDTNDDQNAVALNLENGARINIGEGGIKADIIPKLSLNFNGDVTVGSLTDAWGINRDLEITGKTTFDTTKRELNLEGAATATGTGSTVTVNKEISGEGSIVVTGLGKLKLSAENSYTGGTVVESGTLTVTNYAALGSGGLTVNGGAANLSSNSHNSIVFGAESPLTVAQGGSVKIGRGTSVTISNSTFENAGSLSIVSGGKLELSGGVIELSGTLTNAGTLNIIAQTDGVNSGVVIGDGATFTNSGTVVISAGTLAEGDSVTVFADAKGVGISDSTGTVAGTGTLKVFGGYYENGVFTAGEKKEGSAGEDLGDKGHVKPGQSVTVHDKHHHDKHGRYHAVYLASGAEIVVSQVDNLDCDNINFGGQDYEIGASWDFNIEKDSDTEVFVQMYVGEGLDLDTIKVFHRGHGDNDAWEDYTDTVGNLSYDKETGYLSFTTLTFSSYSVTGIYNSTFVPEPSAFGLLAGLSALALAVSRRRRR